MRRNVALDGIDRMLEEKDADAYLQIDSSDDPDLYYLTGIDIPDPATMLRTDGESTLLLNALEYGRGKREAAVDRVEREARYYQPGDDRYDMLASFLDDHGIDNLLVPGDFPTATAHKLEERGYSIEPLEDSPVREARSVKAEDEINAINETQQHTENAMAVAEAMLEEAEEGSDGLLYHDGEILTAERLRGEIEASLVRDNC
ncbi:MAG: aminopeptidase P family N-terminal domain-containing protein, partial [Candidatus Nanohaloarchaea archaeon]|nr:aminopeptidase P family N-terminal domain-containing protein [Candidatus Nanohaloarchaea archaeon]